MAFAGVVDLKAGLAEGLEEELDFGDYGAHWGDGYSLGMEVAAGGAD